jgi:ADP-ribose pyrophosphatase YjhB (NUDIX family)
MAVRLPWVKVTPCLQGTLKPAIIAAHCFAEAVPSSTGVRLFMSMPRLASSAIVERAGRYLLVRRGNPPAANLYAFPGGRAEPGETPAETALRELLEETGLTGRNPRLFETVELLPEAGVSGSHYMLSVFQVDADDSEPVEAQSDALEAKWFLPEEILDLPTPESVRACVLRLAPSLSARGAA